jgi:hypothetical protein
MGWMVVTGRHWADSAGYGWAVEGSPGTLSMNKGKVLYIPRHHFIFALWHLVDPNPDDVDVKQGKLSHKSKAVGERFEKICQILCDIEVAVDYGNRAAEAVEKAREEGAPIGSQVRKLPFTQRVKKRVAEV